MLWKKLILIALIVLVGAIFAKALWDPIVLNQQIAQCNAKLETPRTECFYELAFEKKMPELCENVKNDSKGNCYFYTIVENSLSSECEKSSDRDVCNAVAQKNLTFCSNYRTPLEKMRCYYYTTLKSNYPNLFKPYKRALSGPPKLFIPDDKLEAAQVCNTLPESNIQEKIRCRNYLEAIQDTCNNPYCNFQKAVINLDETLCGKSDSFADSCYLSVASGKKDEKICNLIQSNETKSKCYESVASQKNDVTICNGLPENFVKTTCYTNVAESIKNVSICSSIPEVQNRDQCIYRVAYAAKNSSFCSGISDAHLKQNCTYQS